MKKLTIAIATALTLGTVQAEYVIKQPLEQHNGGALPDGTIIFKSNSTQAPITPTIECQFELARTFWGAGTDSANDYIFLYWGGDPIFEHTFLPGDGYDTKSITYNGVRYTRGDKYDVFGNFTHYTICREK